jgi:hypothetical protein
MRQRTNEDKLNWKLTAYWVVTAILVLELLVGGEWDIARTPYVVHIVTRLGYPVYILTILGVCKVLAAIAIIAPRFLRLKEWAYAGVVFEMIGAAASHLAVDRSVSEIVVTLIIAGLGFVSWALRPPNRMLGKISK